MELEIESKRHYKRRCKFNAEEDQIIVEFAKSNGSKNWNKITELLPNRTGRQCRERWLNYLDDKISHDNWRLEEDQLLWNLVMREGKKWSTIKTFFPGRTDVLLKNRYKVLARKHQVRFDNKLVDKPNEESVNNYGSMFDEQNNDLENTFSGNSYDDFYYYGDEYTFPYL